MSARRPSPAGATMVELIIAVAILSISIAAVLMAIYGNNRLIKNNREYLHASVHAKQQLSIIEGAVQASDFIKSVLVLYGPAQAASKFQVLDNDGNPILYRVLDASNNITAEVGTIEFPLTGTSLFENTNDALLGMPMDLDCSGAINNNVNMANSDNLKLLPVTIRVRWTDAGSLQQREYVLRSVLQKDYKE